MTEEQLLAQSADDYMNAGQLEFFKQRLLEKATSVRERIAANQSLCMIERHSDASDSASTEEDRAKALRLIDMDNQTLNQISLALTAIADESYGWCADTGEPITLKRLLLIPESLLTVDAMQARESRGKHQRAA
ncbi:TraR/DksA family transcriptional regulator [Pseudomonas putida]|uniref:TraR/DksA family transcriptional regulator n=1 Tax=Pseudomonas putida TaxID=303 RepID=A0A7V8EF07_PSEPU|nr:TraR/DksA family transcriptional regulator [Pseudomonas putida]KAF0253449.1 TraR/DksA family transcriptional regulator [Pseudomonas putida]